MGATFNKQPSLNQACLVGPVFVAARFMASFQLDSEYRAARP